MKHIYKINTNAGIDLISIDRETRIARIYEGTDGWQYDHSVNEVEDVSSWAVISFNEAIEDLNDVEIIEECDLDDGYDDEAHLSDVYVAFDCNPKTGEEEVIKAYYNSKVARDVGRMRWAHFTKSERSKYTVEIRKYTIPVVSGECADDAFSRWMDDTDFPTNYCDVLEVIKD